MFGNGSDAVTPDAAEQRLRKSLDQNGFIMGLQLDSIQSERLGRERDGAWGKLGGLQKHRPVLVEAGGLLGAVMGLGMQRVGSERVRSACVRQDPTQEGSDPGVPCQASLRALSPFCLWRRHSAAHFRLRTSDIPSSSARDPGLGHCSVGPGQRPAAVHHLHLPPPDGEAPSPPQSSPAFCCLVPRPCPLISQALTPLSPQVHLHLPPEKPREAGPAEPEGLLPPHG